MDELIIKILHVKFLRGGPDVAVLVPIPLLVAIDACDADVGANVKFAFLVEKWHDVLLKDMGPLLA
jgi:hypothetical protein